MRILFWKPLTSGLVGNTATLPKSSTIEASTPQIKQSFENKNLKEKKSFLSLPNPLSFLKAILTTSILAFAIYKSPTLTNLGFIEFEKLLKNAASPTNEKNNLPLQKELPRELKDYLWGKEALNTKSITQRLPNCQIIAGLISSTFTEEGLKKLESIVEVTDYNLDQNNFYINFNVHINGKKIPVLYKDLINEIWTTWDPERNIGATKAPLAPHAIAYAIEKELAENYSPDPTAYRALSGATFLTNKSYSFLLISHLRDDSLVEVLKQAPNEIITVSTHGIYNYSKVSREKWLDVNHEYAVKDYRYENGQHLITLTAYNQEITLTLDELKHMVNGITAPTKHFKIFDENTLTIYLLSVLALVAQWKAINLLRKK